jgi:hypothetical protein
MMIRPSGEEHRDDRCRSWFVPVAAGRVEDLYERLIVGGSTRQ